MKRYLVAGLLLTPFVAVAEDGYVDGYYTVSSKFNLDDGDPLQAYDVDGDGDGFGVRALAPVANTLVLTGEYQKNTIDDYVAGNFIVDDGDLSVDQLRFGIGFLAQPNLGLFVEYAEIDVDDINTFSGPAFHARLAAELAPGVGVYGQVGYLLLKDDDFDRDAKGMEYSVGAIVSLGPQWSIFADYRNSALEDEANGELELDDFRAGLRLNF